MRRFCLADHVLLESPDGFLDECPLPQEILQHFVRILVGVLVVVRARSPHNVFGHRRHNTTGLSSFWYQVRRVPRMPLLAANVARLLLRLELQVLFDGGHKVFNFGRFSQDGRISWRQDTLNDEDVSIPGHCTRICDFGRYKPGPTQAKRARFHQTDTNHVKSLFWKDACVPLPCCRAHASKCSSRQTRPP
ncbi:unnamed protein product [Ixodes pacificus]